MRILLVDDEPGIREGLAAFLRLRGHEVRTAGDCAAAGTLLAAQDFELLCTDWRLPDGTAGPLLQAAACPVVVISGYPEEVVRAPNLREVLGKPVAPARLAAVVQAIAAPPPPPADAVLDDLPGDVRRVVGAALAVIDAAAAEVTDDGAFVTLCAPWPGDHLLPEFTDLGGDLRVLVLDGIPTVEVRWCRDGRPDPALPVVRAGEPWPDVPLLAVDFDGTDLQGDEFLAILECASARRRAGRQVCFLNLSPALIAVAEGSGRAGDLPMSMPIGPRLPAVLAELWS
jgi:CheY-like chemotaxis protein